MKTTRANLIITLVGLVALACSERSFCQGHFVFSNTGINGGAMGAIYGPNPTGPDRQQWGNTAEGRPPGTQVYSGTPLEGANYSAEAWYSLTPVMDVFSLPTGASALLGSRSTFYTGIGAGFFISTEVNVSAWTYNPDQPPGQSLGVYLQVRGWDNAGGQLGTWDAAWNAAQAGGGNPVGWSKVFWQPVEFLSLPSPGMFNFESFNIFTVPEPSTFALVGVGGLSLLLFRRRRG